MSTSLPFGKGASSISRHSDMLISLPSFVKKSDPNSGFIIVRELLKVIDKLFDGHGLNLLELSVILLSIRIFIFLQNNIENEIQKMVQRLPEE